MKCGLKPFIHLRKLTLYSVSFEDYGGSEGQQFILAQDFEEAIRIAQHSRNDTWHITECKEEIVSVSLE